MTVSNLPCAAPLFSIPTRRGSYQSSAHPSQKRQKLCGATPAVTRPEDGPAEKELDLGERILSGEFTDAGSTREKLTRPVRRLFAKNKRGPGIDMQFCVHTCSASLDKCLQVSALPSSPREPVSPSCMLGQLFRMRSSFLLLLMRILYLFSRFLTRSKRWI